MPTLFGLKVLVSPKLGMIPFPKGLLIALSADR